MTVWIPTNLSLFLIFAHKSPSNKNPLVHQIFAHKSPSNKNPLVHQTSMNIREWIFKNKINCWLNIIGLVASGPFTSHCTMGQVGLSMGAHCPAWGAPYPTAILSHCTMRQVGLSMGVQCPSWGATYPTVHPIPLYYGTGGTVHGGPLSLLRGPLSHCLSYPTVLWDRWDHTCESTILSEPHCSIPVPLKSKVYSVLW